MENGYTIIAAVAVIIIIIIVAIMKNKKDNSKLTIYGGEESSRSANLVVSRTKKDHPLIQIEMLPAEIILDENKLIEIKDNKVLEHVNNLVPELAQTGNAISNAVNAAQSNGEVLYRAIIPAGAKLTNSQSMKGAFRGFYRGADGIQGHANLEIVKANNGIEIASNSTAAAMNVASMVVGQYYMAQINAELDEINESISKVSDFQDNEYRSRVFSLITHVKSISEFQTEILDNDELRNSKIMQLNNLEEECTKLLVHANLTLADFAKRKGLDYNAYEKALSDAQKWFMYQKALVDVLSKIADLKYTMHLGKVSRKQCNSLLPTYMNQVSDTQEFLTEWHTVNVKRLGVDAEEIRRKRKGFDGVLHFLPGLINEGSKFRPIEETTARMITDQSSGHIDFYYPGDSELFGSDVQLIAKDGKLYYLPNYNES